MASMTGSSARVSFKHRSLSRLAGAALASILVVAAHPARAACPGDGSWSVERELRRAQVVFIGTPTAEWPSPGADAPGGWKAGTSYRVRVDEILRGARRKHVDLFSENGSGRFDMTIGTQYVVFASSCQGRLYAYARGNSGPVAESSKVLAQVRKLTSRR